MQNLPMFVLFFGWLSLFVGTTHAQPATQIHETELGKIKVEVILNDLDHPWGMTKLPDGKLLVTERDGTMRHVDPENPGSSRLIGNIPKVWARGQGGLLDVAADPDFANNRTIYFTFSDPGFFSDAGTAIASAQLDVDPEPKLSHVKILFSMDKKTSAGQHFGSRIVFGPDGNLFITVGDRGQRQRAQDPFDAAGSVLRIAKDGSIPADNPFADGKEGLPQIWSIGHRNPQGATLDKATGQLWTLAHGARGGDEINTPQAGKNYGWPLVSYGTHYSGNKIGVGTSAEGLEQPVHYWDPSIAPSGLDFYKSNQFPKWRGNLFAGALKDEMLVRLELKDGKIVHEEHLLKETYGRIRNVRSYEDGSIWLLTDSSEGLLLQITPLK